MSDSVQDTPAVRPDIVADGLTHSIGITPFVTNMLKQTERLEGQRRKS